MSHHETDADLLADRAAEDAEFSELISHIDQDELDALEPMLTNHQGDTSHE